MITDDKKERLLNPLRGLKGMFHINSNNLLGRLTVTLHLPLCHFLSAGASLKRVCVFVTCPLGVGACVCGGAFEPLAPPLLEA